MEENNRSYQILAVLIKLLYILLENISLETMLKKFIDHITSLSWLALDSKGIIFLVGKDPETLEMKAYKALNKHLLSMCARVPFGRCLCGRAALLRRIQFADCIDERHETEYEGISPHGHYCIPIISGTKKILGVITLYLRERHRRDLREEEFLSAIANTLAVIIELNKSRQDLKERGKELEIKSRNLEEVNNALKILLKKMNEEKIEQQERKIGNLNELFLPYFEKLKKSRLNSRQRTYLEIMESNLNNILSPFSRVLSSKYLRLTPTEIQVADLIKYGKTTKDIAELLNLSPRTIEFHRGNIRNKFGIKTKKANLRTYLLSFQ